MAAILAAIGSVASICGALYGAFKLAVWLGKKTPQQKKEEIDQKIVTEQEQVQQTGRPKW